MKSLFIFILSAYYIVASPITSAGEIDSLTFSPQEVKVGVPVDINIGFKDSKNEIVENQGAASVFQGSVNSNNSQNRINTACAILLNYGDGNSEQIRVESDNSTLNFSHAYKTTGNYKLTVEGKALFRGLKSVFGCKGNDKMVEVSVLNSISDKSSNNPNTQTSSISSTSNSTINNSEYKVFILDSSATNNISGQSIGVDTTKLEHISLDEIKKIINDKEKSKLMNRIVVIDYMPPIIFESKSIIKIKKGKKVIGTREEPNPAWESANQKVKEAKNQATKAISDNSSIQSQAQQYAQQDGASKLVAGIASILGTYTTTISANNDVSSAETALASTPKMISTPIYGESTLPTIKHEVKRTDEVIAYLIDFNNKQYFNKIFKNTESANVTLEDSNNPSNIDNKQSITNIDTLKDLNHPLILANEIATEISKITSSKMSKGQLANLPAKINNQRVIATAESKKALDGNNRKLASFEKKINTTSNSGNQHNRTIGNSSNSNISVAYENSVKNTSENQNTHTQAGSCAIFDGTWKSIDEPTEDLPSGRHDTFVIHATESQTTFVEINELGKKITYTGTLECVKKGDKNYTLNFKFPNEGSVATDEIELSRDLQDWRGSFKNTFDNSGESNYTRTTPVPKFKENGIKGGGGDARSCIQKSFNNNNDKFSFINKCGKSVNLKYTFSQSKPFSDVYTTLRAGEKTFDEANNEEQYDFYSCYAPRIPQTIHGDCVGE